MSALLLKMKMAQTLWSTRLRWIFKSIEKLIDTSYIIIFISKLTTRENSVSLPVVSSQVFPPWNHQKNWVTKHLQLLPCCWNIFCCFLKWNNWKVVVLFIFKSTEKVLTWIHKDIFFLVLFARERRFEASQGQLSFFYLIFQLVFVSK